MGAFGPGARDAGRRLALRRSPVARLAAAASVALAIVLVGLIVLGGGSSYRVRLLFSNASGLVSGNQVMIGPATVGSVDSIGLTRHGQAAVVIGLDGGAAPLHRGTVARIEENGLAGIADHYITLEPAAASSPTIPSGGTIASSETHSEVSLDELFDALNPLTRSGIRNLIRGEATAIRGRTRDANRALEYLAPALYSTSQVTAELSRSEPAFDALLVQGARTMQALAGRAQQLTQLVANTDAATGAIAQQSSALADSLDLLPTTLDRTTATLAGLRSTLTTLTPLVDAAKPATRRLESFSAQLRQFAQSSIPTLAALAAVIQGKSGSVDLITLLRQTPGLASVAGRNFPEIVAALNDSHPQLDYLRAYTPDVVAALTNVGQASANYDADGHYTRVLPWFGAFGITPTSQLTPQPPADRYAGLRVVHGRCPGGAAQPAPDHSAPVAVAGCKPSSSPSGL